MALYIIIYTDENLGDVVLETYFVMTPYSLGLEMPQGVFIPTTLARRMTYIIKQRIGMLCPK